MTYSSPLLFFSFSLFQNHKQVDDLSSLTALIRLDLSDNPKLHSLDRVLESTSNSLKHLVAARCAGISSKPSSLLLPRGLRLPRLRVVDLSSSGLRSFDASSAPKLSALILTGNKGVEVSGLSSCKELSTLVVKGCALGDAALSLALEGCSSLVKLSAAHNELRGGKELDLTALRSTLSELRLGHNDLRALPSGLSSRLRVLDLGGNPRLGPLRSVAGELARLCGDGNGNGSKNSSWLRSVTLRGTAASQEKRYEAAVVSAAPALRVLDDKRVSRGGIPPLPPPPASAAEDGEGEGEGQGDEAERRSKRKKDKERKGSSSTSSSSSDEEGERRGERRDGSETKKKRPNAAATVGRLSDETGLAGPAPPSPPPPLQGGKQQQKSADLPPPPPLPPPATPEAEAAAGTRMEKPGGAAVAAKVIEVKKKEKKWKSTKSEKETGVATGRDAARLLAAAAAVGGGAGVLEEAVIGGWD